MASTTSIAPAPTADMPIAPAPTADTPIAPAVGVSRSEPLRRDPKGSVVVRIALIGLQALLVGVLHGDRRGDALQAHGQKLHHARLNLPVVAEDEPGSEIVAVERLGIDGSEPAVPRSEPSGYPHHLTEH